MKCQKCPHQNSQHDEHGCNLCRCGHRTACDCRGCQKANEALIAGEVEALRAEVERLRPYRDAITSLAPGADERLRLQRQLVELAAELATVRAAGGIAERAAAELPKLREQVKELKEEAHQARGEAQALLLRLEAVGRGLHLYRLLREVTAPPTGKHAVFIEKVDEWERKHGRVVDPDPRTGRPGGADLVTINPEDLADLSGGYKIGARKPVPPPAPAAPKPDTRWAAGHAPDFSPPAAPEPDPALTVADLRRADGPGPVDVAEALEDLRGLEGGLNSDCVIVEKGERFIVERPAARGNYKVSRPSGATIGFVAPTGKVRRVGNWETYEETAPAAPVVQRVGVPQCTCAMGTCTIHGALTADRAPNMRAHRWKRPVLESTPCLDCGVRFEHARGPCPGPKGGDGG